MAQLHVLLSGPFVLCNDSDLCFRVLIPDLLDTHFKPGFNASHNSLELENGIWSLNVGQPCTDRVHKEYQVEDGFFPLYTVQTKRPPCSHAYAVVKFSRAPDDIKGLSPTGGDISQGSSASQESAPAASPFATRAVLVFNSVDLETLNFSPTVAWNPRLPDKEHQPSITAIDSVGLLTLDMKPLMPPVGEDHARMAFRSMGRLVGLDRYMQPHSLDDALRNGQYNDCGAAIILVFDPMESK